jgi:acyl dehydratase
MFGGLSASSAHTFSIFILLTTKLQHRFHVLAAMGWDELRLPNESALRTNSISKTTVLEKRESRSKPDRGIVRDQIHLRNQRRETVLQCIASVSLRGDRMRKQRREPFDRCPRQVSLRWS